MTEEPNSPTSTIDEADASKSALQDNIDRMGKNAYYFAHAHKATGPKWDGKIEPRLLSSSSNLTSASEGISERMPTVSVASEAAKALASRSISLSKSNITNYAFLDDGAKVKIYVNLPGVGNTPTENITLESTETSMCLTVKDYLAPNPTDDDDLICDTSGEEGGNEKTDGEADPRREDRCLSFAQLFGEIETSMYKKKQDKIVVILKKKDEKEWPSVIA